MANRYVRATGGNYSAAGTWELTPGGGETVAIPTSSDDVKLIVTSGQLTIDAASVAKTVDCTGYLGTLTHSAFNWVVSGSVTLVATMTYTPASGSTLSINATATLTTGGKLIYVLGISGATITLGDNLSFRAAKDTALQVSSTGALNMNGKTIAGNSTVNRPILRSNTPGVGSGTIILAGGAFSNFDFMDCVFDNGGADLHLEAITGLSGDCGGNSMTGGGALTFTTPANQHWVNDASGNWSDSTKWTSRIPLCQDNVFLDRSFTARTISMDMIRAGKSIDWSGASGTVTWGSSNSPTFFGSLDMTNLTTLANQAMTFAGRGAFSIKSAGKSTTANQNITAPGGTYTLLDAFNCGANALIVNYGSFNSNNFTISCGSFTDGTSTASVLTLGSSTINLTKITTGIVWNTSVAITLNAGTSNINILNATTNAALSFYGYTNQIFNNVNMAANPFGGSISYFYTTYFNSFVANAPNTLFFNVGYTLNIANPVFNGSAGKMVILGMAPQTTSGVNAILNYTGSNIVNANYVQVQGVNVTPANKWFWGNTQRGIGLDFKGQTSSGDNVSIANSATTNQWFGSTAFSFECWAYTRSLGATNGRLLDKGTPYNLYTSTTNPSFSVQTSGGTVTATGNAYSYNQLHHYVGVWNGTNITLYVDGVAGTPVGTSGTPTNDTANSLFLGNNAAGTRTQDGIIYTTRLYRNKALSAGEVTTAFQAGAKSLLPVSGCTSQYMFNEATGATLTDSVNAVNGTIAGAGWTTNWLNKLGLSFRGQAASGDTITVTDTAAVNRWFGCSAYTMEAWIYPRSIGATAGRVIDKSQILLTNSGGSFQCNFSGGNVSLSASPAIVFNQLNHIVGVWDGTNVNLYVNGVSVATPVASSGTPSNEASNMFIGNNTSSIRTFDGDIIAVRIYRNKGLSLADVIAAYYAGPNASLPVSGATQQFLFNEGTGSTLTDSVNAVNGTISGAVWANTGWVARIGQFISSLFLAGD